MVDGLRGTVGYVFDVSDTSIDLLFGLVRGVRRCSLGRMGWT